MSTIRKNAYLGLATTDHALLQIDEAYKKGNDVFILREGQWLTYEDRDWDDGVLRFWLTDRSGTEYFLRPQELECAEWYEEVD